MPRGLHVGAAVRLTGLRSAPELNNAAGRCLQYDTDAGRWLVKLLNGNQKSVKAENLQICASLRPGSQVRVGGLVGAAQLNGRLGICSEWDESAQRWLVSLDNGDLKSIRPENLEDWRLGPTNGEQSRSRERKRSRSGTAHNSGHAEGREQTSSRQSSGTSLLTFGRHNGRQYEDVFMNDAQYCQWASWWLSQKYFGAFGPGSVGHVFGKAAKALSCQTPRGAMLRFVSWLRLQLMSGRAPGEAARPARPARPPPPPQQPRDAPNDRLREAVREWLRPAGTPQAHEMQPGNPPSVWHRGSGSAHYTGPQQADASSAQTVSGAPRRPDAQQVLDRLPRVAFKSQLFSGSPYPEACPICMEDWVDVASDIVLTTCLHVFHASCLGGWLVQCDSCPSCRWNIHDTGEERAMNCSKQASQASGSSGQAVHLSDSDSDPDSVMFPSELSS